MTALQIIYLVVLAICILSSGFFSGSETALVGVPRERVHQHEHTFSGKRLADLISDPERMLSTLLLANNFVNILGAAVATALFIDLLGEDWGPWAATGVVTAVILVIGEITPKSLATRYPVEFSLIVAPAVWTMSRVLRPLSRIFQGIATVLLRVIGLAPTDNRMTITEEDIRALAVLSEKEGEINAAEREIIHSLFQLADRPVREVMTPRVDMVTLSHPVSMEGIREVTSATGHSRFPVVDGELDHVIGVLYVKDLLRQGGDEPAPEDIGRLLREPVFVPETKSVLELLQEMRLRHLAFAVVLDEHGGVEGVVTVKDLISELVGELQDEYDPGSPSIVEVSAEGEWIADGRLPVEELAAGVGRELPVGPYATAAGLFLHLAGRIPSEGETLTTAGLEFTVKAMDRRRIDRLVIKAVDSPAEPWTSPPP